VYEKRAVLRLARVANLIGDWREERVEESPRTHPSVERGYGSDFELLVPIPDRRVFDRPFRMFRKGHKTSVFRQSASR